MHLINRNHCVFTGTSGLEFLFKLDRFPVYMGCTEADPSTDLFAPMSWWIDPATGSIQLNPLLPLDVLYAAQHNESFGGIWTAHHKAFAAFLKEAGAFQNVFEIGGAHGILSKEYAQLYSNASWTILEPNPKLVEGAKATVIKGFFDEHFSFTSPFDVVVHSHVFEHIYEPAAFIEQLAAFIPVGKHMVFSIPNMLRQLECNFTNCLNFEHTVFLTEEYVLWLLGKNGFILRNKQHFGEHSTFYAVENSGVKQSIPCPNLYERNKSIFTGFIHYHDKLISDLNAIIRNTDKAVYIFGAHIFSLYLIQHGLDESKINAVLDNGPMKIGKRLYGTGLTVFSPKILANQNNALVILKAGIYNNEIKTDIINNINPHVEFIE